jgi:SAM-dependent methyltransferase
LAQSLEFDGERVVPGKTPVYLMWAHTSRYQFARRLIHGKRLLDAGCGEGYGVRYLAQDVEQAVGIDIDPVAASHARSRYAEANLNFAAMDCCRLGFADQSFDFITSFEVIEHFTDADGFLSEIHRVIAPGGVFVVSTPNKARTPAGVNPFHDKEYLPGEFDALLRRHFSHVETYGQVCTRPIRERLFLASTRLYLKSKVYRNAINSLAGLYFHNDRSEQRESDPNWLERAYPASFVFRSDLVREGTYLIAVCRKES